MAVAVQVVEDSRQRVLITVLALFSTHGYFATSLQDISRESGVSIGSIYHHFGDKEGIARALYHSLSEQMTDRLERITRRHSGAHDTCRAVVKLLFEMTEAEPLVMNFMLYAKHQEFLPEEPPICSSRPFALMRDMVKRGMDTGEIRQMDLMVASTSMFGGAIRMVMARLDGVLPTQLNRYLDEVWDCAWRSVAAD